MNIFSSLSLLIPVWKLKSARRLTQKERAELLTATVVPSMYGYSVELKRKNGEVNYIPVDTNLGEVLEGTKVDIDRITILTLVCDDKAILRVRF
jgi:hypothetical protein